MAEAAIVEDAPGKLNLDLHVLGRREDGYHELDSLVVFVGVADRLTLEPADRLELLVEGPWADGVPVGADNLVHKAARDLAEMAGRPAAARVRLEKRLPVAAGLGGGSADAAAVLRGLGRLWRHDLPHGALAALAMRLGADVPVCLGGRAARLRGAGERLDAQDRLPALAVLLVNPRVALATAAVFAALGPVMGHPGRPPLPTDGEAEEVVGALRESRNDLEAPAQRLLPVIGDVLGELRRLPGCRLARMSGSGPTCFGIFATSAEAEAGAARLAARRPGWWMAPTLTRSAGP